MEVFNTLHAVLATALILVVVLGVLHERLDDKIYQWRVNRRHRQRNSGE